MAIQIASGNVTANNQDEVPSFVVPVPAIAGKMFGFLFSGTFDTATVNIHYDSPSNRSIRFFNISTGAPTVYAITEVGLYVLKLITDELTLDFAGGAGSVDIDYVIFVQDRA